MGVPYAEVIGDPVAHSKSPLIHKFWLGKLGLDYDYRATRVPAGQLAACLEVRRQDPQWCGCSLTLPHKLEAAQRVDQMSERARFVGAVNCIVRKGRAGALAGHNTDVAGFIAPLLPWLDKPRMRLAYVVGTGGAAAAVSVALDRQGFVIVSIGRDRAKALALRHRLQLLDDHLAADLAPYARRPVEGDRGERTDQLVLLVNATPLGMSGYPPLPFDLEYFPPDALVYDLVYNPPETPLLKAARERGMVTMGGLDMLVPQAAEAFELLFGTAAPRQHDSELRELLTR